MTASTVETAPPDNQTPDSQTLEWHEGDMPYSREFGDHFYCREDGRLECGHVFLGGNDLPARWAEDTDFTIGELGFGTGLNVCETWRQWKTAGPKRGRLHVISFERFPMQAKDMARALSRWPEIERERQALCDAWPQTPPTGKGTETISLALEPGMQLTVVCGDAAQTLPGDGVMVDAWYLDGFAPSRNPDLWSETLLQAVFHRTVPGGTFATYAAAGFVRRNLQAAGFIVERRPGFGGKREMLAGRRTTG